LLHRRHYILGFLVDCKGNNVIHNAERELYSKVAPEVPPPPKKVSLTPADAASQDKSLQTGFDSDVAIAVIADAFTLDPKTQSQRLYTLGSTLSSDQKIHLSATLKTAAHRAANLKSADSNIIQDLERASMTIQSGPSDADVKTMSKKQ